MRAKFIAAAICACVMSATTAFAYEEKPFTMADFTAAQAAGKPILVDVYAPWCPTCQAQQKVFETLKSEAKYDALTIFKVDYDHQTDALKHFKVQKQSTLIGFKGDKETGRSLGDTNAASIGTLIDSALK